MSDGRGFKPDLWTDEFRSIDPTITYDGPFPSRPRDYYELGWCGARYAYVYLLFDADNQLLYVGRARRPGNRFDKHRRQKPWWPSVSRLVLLGVTGESRADAHALVSRLEMHAIRTLDPLHNIAGRTS